MDKKEKKRGILRVGRIKNANDMIKLPGFTSIVVMTASSKFGMLSPFQLKTKDNIIIENKWQFMKVYKKVPETTQYYSRFNKIVIWQYHEEEHVDDDDNILPEYYDWQKAGFNCKWACRYPVSYYHRTKCLYMLYNGEKLDYIQSRKKVYLPLYLSSVVLKKEWKQLKERLYNGENLLILECDGPHQESLGYYKEKYKVKDNFIEKGTMLVKCLSVRIFHRKF